MNATIYLVRDNFGNYFLLVDHIGHRHEIPISPKKWFALHGLGIPDAPEKTAF